MHSLCSSSSMWLDPAPSKPVQCWDTSSLHMAGSRCRTMNVLLNVWRQCLTLLERCPTAPGQTDPRHCHHPCFPAQGFQCWLMPVASEDSSTALSSCQDTLLTPRGHSPFTRCSWPCLWCSCSQPPTAGKVRHN